MANTSKAAAPRKANVAVTAAAKTTDDANLPKFPRKMKLVNDTAQSWVIGGAHVAPSSSTTYIVRDEDSLARHRADCEHILSVSDHYKPGEPEDGDRDEPNKLRIEEADDELAADEQSDGETA